MKASRRIMGMPIELEIVSVDVPELLEAVFAYFVSVDERFSTYKDESEIMHINRGELALVDASREMQEVVALGEKTKKETGGYFDIRHPSGQLDPSGIVKGWAILNAERLVREAGAENYFLNVGGDIASDGAAPRGIAWRVGIRNPFNTAEIVKVITPRGKGVATSGSYERGAHIYNPLKPDVVPSELVSLTVIADDVLEADRFATAAFAMGKEGLNFLETLPRVEAYAIDAHGIATLTSGFAAYAVS